MLWRSWWAGMLAHYCVLHTSLQRASRVPTALQMLAGVVFARFAACDIHFFMQACSTFLHTFKTVVK